MKMKRIASLLLAMILVASTTTALAASGTLRYNDRGAAVTLLQQMLNQLGYTTSVDGVFGPGTQAAVQSFQAAQGLKVDGVAGPATLALLTSQTLGTGSAAQTTASGNGAGRIFNGNYEKMTRGCCKRR